MKKVLAFFLSLTVILSSIPCVIVSAAGTTAKAPGIIYTPWKLEPGEVGAIYGGNFDADKSKDKIAIQPLSGFVGELLPDSAAVKIMPFNVTEQFVQFEIPKDLKYDEYAIWVKNSVGWSKVSYTNKAQIYWVNEHEIYEGQKLTIMGRSMVDPTNRSADHAKVEFVEAGSTTGITADIYGISDFTASLVVPEGLKTGSKYEIRYTNGAGGEYGWAEMQNKERESVTVFEKTQNTKYFDDKYNLNISWFSDINTSNIINVKDLGAVGDGKTSDAINIQKAVDQVGKAGGGVVYFPNGTYLINRINIGAKTILQGESKDNCILKWDGKPCPESPRTTIKRSAFLEDGKQKTSGYYEANKLLYTDEPHVGIFDLSLLSETIRPASFNIDKDSKRCIYGYLVTVAFLGGFDEWNDEVQPSGKASPKNSGYVIKNVNINGPDTSALDIWSEKNIVVEDCNFDISHLGMELRGTTYARIRNNKIKNVNRPILYMDGRDWDGDDVGRGWIQGNTMIGNNLMRKVQAGEAKDPGWTELATNGATEHRVTDYGGDENLFMDNTIEGTFGDNIDNSGEGLQSQSQRVKFLTNVVSSTDTSITFSMDVSDKIKQPGIDNLVILNGAGLGQVRKVKEIKGDTLIIDKPWDVIPTKDSMCLDNERIMARTTLVGNHFNASNNKGSLHMYKCSYDTVMYDNNITDGGGIWYGSVFMPSTTRADFHYFLTIENNLISGSSSKNHSGQITAIGPANDGGFDNFEEGDGSVTLNYGTKILHNSLTGMGTIGDKLVGGDKDKYALSSGIFVSKSADKDYPIVWGSIIDGNTVKNTIAGVHLSNTSYDTVLRNNDFKGNGIEIDEKTESKKTMYLKSDDGFKPGNKEIKEIDISSLKKNSAPTKVADKTDTKVDTEPTTQPEEVIDTTVKAMFDDIQDHWARADIEKLAKKEIIKGVSATSFAPDDFITRAEFTALIVRCLALPDTAYKGAYYDVYKANWFSPVMQAAKDANIIDTHLTLNNKVFPNQSLTREEMTSMMVNACNKEGITVDILPDLSIFDDSSEITDWLKDYVAGAYGLELIKGVDAHNFAPKQNLTRAQVAVILNRMLNIIKKGG